MSWTTLCSIKQLCYLNYLFTELLQILLNTLTHPKYVLVIQLPSSPHTRRNIRHCSSIFEKKRISFYTDAFFPPLSCPTIPSIRSFKATEKLEIIHSFVICKVSLFSDGFKENIYFTTLSPKLQFVINRSHHMKWRCRLVLCDVHRCCLYYLPERSVKLSAEKGFRSGQKFSSVFYLQEDNQNSRSTAQQAYFKLFSDTTGRRVTERMLKMHLWLKGIKYWLIVEVPLSEGFSMSQERVELQMGFAQTPLTISARYPPLYSIHTSHQHSKLYERHSVLGVYDMTMKTRGYMKTKRMFSFLSRIHPSQKLTNVTEIQLDTNEQEGGSRPIK